MRKPPQIQTRYRDPTGATGTSVSGRRIDSVASAQKEATLRFRQQDALTPGRGAQIEFGYSPSTFAVGSRGDETKPFKVFNEHYPMYGRDEQIHDWVTVGIACRVDPALADAIAAKKRSVTRYAVTSTAEPAPPEVIEIDPDFATPHRVLIQNDASGVYVTAEEATEMLIAMMRVNRIETRHGVEFLGGAIRLPLAVCPVECWLPSLQPMRAILRPEVALPAPDASAWAPATPVPVEEPEEEQPSADVPR